jgi:diguanylate cyclase (GGDEF)-like protein/PAS domain S-box-containing protein
VSRFTEVDDAMTDLLGWTPEQLIGRSTVELVHPDDAEAAIETWMEMRAGAVSRRVRARMRHANGNYVWLEVSNDNHLNDPELECVITEFVDISAEMAQIEALQERERLLARLAEALPIGICQLRATREVVYCNEPLIELLGPIEHIDTMFRRVARRDRRALELALDHAFAGGSGSVEVGVITDVDERRCELTFRAMVNDDGTIDGVIVCAADVTDRSRLRAELEHRASHDALTGCLNRAATAAEVERMLCEGRHVAIVFIDLDDFKAINDDIGHAAGDELLRVAAGRLRSVARSDDVLGRLGGDEFVVVCGSTYSQLDPDALAERFASGVNGDVVFAGQRVTLRASVGAALSVTGESDVEGLFHRADVAMYAAKRRARAGAGGLH